MKTMIKLLSMLALVCGLGLNAKAQQYGLLTTLKSVHATNALANATPTNLNAVVTLTRHDEFVLEFVIGTTNPQASSLSVQWDTSADGVNYPGAGGLPVFNGHNKGWFSIPLTNATPLVFTTNIVVNSMGYWRLSWLTNVSAVFLTNIQIKAYAKPRTSG